MHRKILTALAFLSFASALILIPMQNHITDPQAQKTTSFGEVFTPQTLKNALKGDTPVFTEMTAAWCITCKVNHAIAINISATKTLFAENDVTYLVGDWTNEDPEITKYLQKYGRNGVPLYVYYGPRDPVTNMRPEPKILPQVLTPALVENFVKGQN